MRKMTMVISIRPKDLDYMLNFMKLAAFDEMVYPFEGTHVSMEQRDAAKRVLRVFGVKKGDKAFEVAK